MQRLYFFPLDIHLNTYAHTNFISFHCDLSDSPMELIKRISFQTPRQAHYQNSSQVTLISVL